MRFLTDSRCLARALLVFASTGVTVLLVDTTCRIGMASWRWVEELQAERRPLPYEHADYFSREFFDDQSRVRLVRATSEPYLLHEDTVGRYINIVNGLRSTTDHPSLPARRLLVFGGSTILAQEVPDRHTIPSYLQRMINASCDTRVAVLNYGVNSVTAAQNRARLMDVGVQPHDIVVFYAGVNDVYYTVYGDEPLLDPQADEGPDSRTILDSIMAASAIPSVVATLQSLAVPDSVTDPPTLRRNLDHLGTDYRYQLVETLRFVTQHRGDFVHFLQPHLFATALATAYRREIARDSEVTPPGVDIAFQLGYPRLREALRDAARYGVESFDVSGLLAVERVPGEVFLDFAHVNHVGNDIIARAIFAKVANRIGDCGRTVPATPGS